ncbi:MAG: protein kinase [Sandaracinaceae bacterium]|nr:protein kinase [Sandaracinaceae bacterium]
MREDDPTLPGAGADKTFCERCGHSVSPNAEACGRCGTPCPQRGFGIDPRIGTLVAGAQYRVLRRLGEGGFGVVYEVETLVGGLRRALKVLNARGASDPELQRRFRDEASILEEINHANVVRCYAAGHLERAGELYLLLELVEGVPLWSIVRDPATRARRPLEPRRAVRLAKQIASGLAAAHRVGVLHRDLKPDNVLIVDPGTREEQAKLLDFGVAKVLGTEAEAAVSSGIVGTPSYMAPEQFQEGRPLDARTDLYALGAVLYVMLTGAGPFDSAGASLGAIFAAQARHRDAGPLPSALVPALAEHPALDRLVAGLLACEPDVRPSSAADLCAELARLEHALSDRGAADAGESLVRALAAVPGERAWLALLAHVSAGGEARTDLVAAAVRALERWPDALRPAPLAALRWVDGGPESALWPLVRSLDLSGRELEDEDVARLARSPALSTVAALDLSRNAITSEGLAALASSPHLGSLEVLCLSRNRITSRGVADFAARAGCLRLRALELAENRLDAAGARAIATSRFRLRVLDLSRTDLGAEAALALAAGPALEGLEVLRLEGNRVGPEGARAIASAPFGRLASLELARNLIGAAGARAIASAPWRGGLAHLGLAENAIDRDGARSLLAATGLERLDSLDLGGNTLGAAGAIALASAPVARRLTRLALGDGDLRESGLAALLGAGGLVRLRALDLSNDALDADAVGLLEEAPFSLEHLTLDRNPLGRGDARALGRALARLGVRSLGLSGSGLDGVGLARALEGARVVALDASECPLDAAGAQVLAASGALGRLSRLELAGAPLGPAGVAALLPHLEEVAELALSGCGLGDEGIDVVVAHAPRLARLTDLSIAGDALGPRAVDALAASALAPHLARLDLSHDRLGDAGAEALARASTFGALTTLSLAGNGIGLAGTMVLLGAGGLGRVSRLDLSNNERTGRVDVYSLSRQAIARMEESFAGLAAHGDAFADRFYDELFARHPSVRPLFARTDMTQQKRHLLHALTLAIDNLRNPALLEQNLRALGARHVAYGARAPHYHAVTSAMLFAMEVTLGDDFTEAHAAAWSRGLRAVSEVMLSGARDATLSVAHAQ